MATTYYEKTEPYEDWYQLISDYRRDFPPEEQWAFRGHKDAGWHLKTTLERELEKYKIPVEQAPRFEQQILREFVRKVGIYDPHFDPEDAIQCLSFIQHYGGPTRLMDWTYSFYVAAFFALAPAALGSKAAIWCFKTGAWDANPSKPAFFGRRALQAMKDDRALKKAATHELMFGLPQLESLETAFGLDAKPCVHQLISRFLNDRITRQQGLFLAQTVLDRPFEENLNAMLRVKSFKGSIRQLVIDCNPELVKQALLDLRRMTITYESLFGEVEYFCRSLALGIADRYYLLTGANGTPLLGGASPARAPSRRATRTRRIKRKRVRS